MQRTVDLTRDYDGNFSPWQIESNSVCNFLVYPIKGQKKTDLSENMYKAFLDKFQNTLIVCVAFIQVIHGLGAP